MTPAGDDAGSGSETDPWRTIDRALRVALPGDAVELGSGTYPAFTVTASGAADAWIVVRSAAGAHVTIDAVGGETAIDLEGARFVALSGLTVRGSGDPFGAGILVRRSHDVAVVASTITSNRGFGLRVVDSRSVTMLENDISHDGTGIELEGDVAGSLVAANAIHDQDRMIVNDAAPDNDRGAVGVNLYHVVGPVSIVRNRLWRNRAPSHDYGTDGGAFDVFGATDVTFADGLIGPGNDSVLETGTDGPAIDRVVFTRNTVFDPHATVHGIVVHAGEALTVSDNVLFGLRDFALAVTGRDRFSGPLTHLAVEDNLVLGRTAVVWSFGRPLPPGAYLDGDTTGCGQAAYADVVGQGRLRTLADLQSATGRERAGATLTDPNACEAAARTLAATFAAAGIPIAP